MPWIDSCLCQQAKKPRPSISPPIHLLLKPDGLGNQTHAFKCKVFKKPIPCHLCHQPILQQGSCCRVCKYVCHKVCENRGPARYTDTSWQIHYRLSRMRKKSPGPRGDSKTSVDGSKTSTLNPDYSTIEFNNNQLAKKESNTDTLDRDETTTMTDSTVIERTKTVADVHGGGQRVNSVCSSDPTDSDRTDLVDHVETNDHIDLHIYETSNHENAIKRSTSTAGVMTQQPRSNHKPSRTDGMDLSYVTERIIALWFPSDLAQSLYRQLQSQASHMLHNKHGNNYMVFNLSEPQRVTRNAHGRVREVGWPSELAPPLERLCSICKDIDNWLLQDKNRIAVLLSRGSKQRLGVVVAAYMHYSSICGSADQALDRFAMKRFLDDTIGLLELPSNNRYVDYFTGLLSGNIRINSSPLYLTHVTVLGAPAFEITGACRAFIKVYEGLVPVYTSGIYNINNEVKRFTLNIANERQQCGLQLRGDILIKCYHRRANNRETIFACQFHTCAVNDYTLSFSRLQLDVACNDLRFPLDGLVELHFSPTPDVRQPSPAPTPAVPVEFADDRIVRYDSYENLAISDTTEDESDETDGEPNHTSHTYGPVDGSIYATVAKKPDLSPGAVSTGIISSPLTVSMDSGISSAGHQIPQPNVSSTSPPLVVVKEPSDDRHRELDELLNDMLLTVENIPDLKIGAGVKQLNLDAPTQVDGSARDFAHVQSSVDGAQSDTLESVIHTLNSVSYETPNRDEVTMATQMQANQPYHSRYDSRPFTYGNVPVDQGMVGARTGLASPSLVRKASFGRSEERPKAGIMKKSDAIEAMFTDRANDAFKTAECDRQRPHDLLKRSNTEGTLRRRNLSQYRREASQSPYSDSESLSPTTGTRGYDRSAYVPAVNGTSNLTWLQRQQQKLKDRREQQLRDERKPHESRLISELRSAQTTHRFKPTASYRLDGGYTSDTTAFADDDDDFLQPLHINTEAAKAASDCSPTSPHRPHRVSSIKYRTSSSSSSQNRRRYDRDEYDGQPHTDALCPLSPLQIIEPDDVRFTNATECHANKLTAHRDINHIDTPTSERSSYDEPSAHRNALNQLLNNLATIDANSTRTECRRVDKNNNVHFHPHLGVSKSSAWLMNDVQKYRDDSLNSTWRSVNDSDSSGVFQTTASRPQTPAFPVQPRTPYSNMVQFDMSPAGGLPPKSPTTQRKDFYSTSLLNGNTTEYASVHNRNTSPRNPSPKGILTNNKSGTYHDPPSTSPTVYYTHSRRSSVHSNSEPPQEVSAAHVKFVRDSSKIWYRPTITREEAIQSLRDKPPGTFIVRDSNSFPGAFGLALKVATPPPIAKVNNGDELIRHFLIEPTAQGVRLKGLNNEPVFSSLSALVYQHSVMPLALPCKLVLPASECERLEVGSNFSTAQQLLAQGAACNVLYLITADMESLTGPQAVRKAITSLLSRTPAVKAIIVHFKVSGQGITLTDNKRKAFFRRHYPANAISYCGLDPDDRRWSVVNDENATPISSNRFFGFIARKPASNTDNQCHVFAELEPEQPATAIVNFVAKVMMTHCQGTSNIV